MDHDSSAAIKGRGRDYAHAISMCHGRQDAVDLYYDALETYGHDGVDWRQVNAAVLARWSASSLDWIKRRAWKAVKSASGTGGSEAK